MDNFQEKEHLVKLENVKVNLQIQNIQVMQLNYYQIYQAVQTLQKLKLYKKLKIIKMQIQFNIMIRDIDKKNSNYKLINILQLKWKLYSLIQKKNYKLI